MATFMQKINCSYDTAHNGLVSTTKIREFEREHNAKPSCIMAVTGVSSAGFQHQAITAGIDNYLIKPLSLRALKTLMNIA